MPGQAAAAGKTLGLQVSPYKTAGKTGQHNVSAPVTVTNTTGNAETVHAQFIALAKVPGGCSASAPPS